MKLDHVTSRDNTALVRLRKLVADPGGYRKTGSVWIEGDHLLRAALQRGWTPGLVVATEAAMQDGGLKTLADGRAQARLAGTGFSPEVSRRNLPAVRKLLRMG